MFISDQQKIAAVFKGFSRRFDDLVKQRGDEELFRLLAQETRSNEFSRELFFSTRLGGGMKEDTGEFDIGSIKLQSLVISTKRWYDAFQMNREDLQNDRLSLYRPHIERLVESYRTHRLQLVIQTLESGWTATGFDGVTFFNDAHPLSNGGTNDNVVAGPLNETNLKQALIQLARMKDDSGELIGLRGTHLLVPPELEIDALKLVDAVTVGGGNANVLAGRLQVVVSPHLTSATQWYVIDASRGSQKPVLFYTVDRPRLEMDDSRAVLNDLLFWVAKARYNAALGLYHFVVGGTG